MRDTIFVAIAAYTDPELPRTLADASEKARNPDALSFGVCWQADPAAPVPLDRFRTDRRYRWVDTTIEASQGGPWARNIAQSLWRGEPYTLQIDSHMLF
ncbi:MAG: GlcNAc-transferase family protein, partial [Thermoanaerobaculia bacterium]|nr:GlcNAc-transferase family protein [Thermoanaerobaculia bacterium]